MFEVRLQFVSLLLIIFDIDKSIFGILFTGQKRNLNFSLRKCIVNVAFYVCLLAEFELFTVKIMEIYTMKRFLAFGGSL